MYSRNTLRRRFYLLYYNRIDSIEAVNNNECVVCYNSYAPCENQTVVVTFYVDMTLK